MGDAILQQTGHKETDRRRKQQSSKSDVKPNENSHAAMATEANISVNWLLDIGPGSHMTFKTDEFSYLR